MSRRKLKLDRSGPWIGVAGMFIVLWYAISSVLYAPWWGVLLSLALLVPESMLLARWARTKPGWCVVVPILGALLNAGLAYGGATWWGWGA
jgi:hypothetical protein